MVVAEEALGACAWGAMCGRHDRCGLEMQQHRPNGRMLDVVLVAPTVRGLLHELQAPFAHSLWSMPSAHRLRDRWERWGGAQREVLRNPCSTVHRLGGTGVQCIHLKETE